MIAEETARPRRNPLITKIAHRYGVVVVWIILIAAFGAVRPSTFLTASNFEAMFGTQAVLLLLTLSLVVTLSVNEFDLSVASILGVSATVIAVLNAQHGWPIVPALLLGLAVGPLVGAINAFFIVFLDIDAIIVTLGMGTLLLGIGLLISNSTAIGGVSSSLTTVTLTRVWGLPVSFYYAIGFVIAIWYVQQFTPLGRYMLFTGRNREVARLAGIRVNRIRWGAYVVGGLIAAVAGVVTLGVGGGIETDSTQTLLLPAFAAAFLGAAVIHPGRFNAWGAAIAIFFLITGITGLQLLGLSGWIQDAFYGAALIMAVTVSRLMARTQT